MNKKKSSNKLKSLIAVLAVVLLSGAGISVSDVNLPFSDDQNTKVEQSVDSQDSDDGEQSDDTEEVQSDSESSESTQAAETKTYEFKSDYLLNQHWEKHGDEFDYDTKEEYVEGANRVINSPDALTKEEKEDGDDVFYLEDSNEFVILSKQGYIRTYFKPSSGKKYYDRQ